MMATPALEQEPVAYMSANGSSAISVVDYLPGSKPGYFCIPLYRRAT